MSPQDIQQKLLSPTSIIVVALLLILGVGGYFGVQAFTRYQATENAKEVATTETIQKQEASLIETQKQLEKLSQETAAKIAASNAETKAVEKRLQEEKAKRIAEEETRKKEEEQKPKAIDTSLIISQWRTRLAHVECQWFFQSGRLAATSSGSGVLIKSKQGPVVVLTNRHVIIVEGRSAPVSCNITLPDNPKTYTALANRDDILINETYDYGEIIIRDPDVALTNLFARPLEGCVARPLLGEAVLILGYPSIGSKNDITVTEGIISGYDGEYFITSAKVEKGNSGGAAILPQKNCYLGIPTFVRVGEIESLARILNWHVAE